MPGVEIRRGPRVDKDRIGVVVAAMLAQPSRIDQQSCFSGLFLIQIASAARALSVYSDRFANRTKSTATEQVCQSRFDFLRHAGAFVDERGVKLDERSAGADVQPRILSGGDSADADDRDLPAGVRIDVADQ